MRFSTILPLLFYAFIVQVNNVYAGPFGFEPGMTQEQLIEKVGKDAVEQVPSQIGLFKVSKAPTPHSLFKEYRLIIDPKRGLVKLIAQSKNISASAYGDELKNSFNETEKSVVSTYGECQRVDGLKEGSLWDEPKDYMVGLLKKERTLASFWPKERSAKLKGQIVGIVLEANATYQNTGYLLLSYQFEGFDEFLNEKKNKENQVF